MRLHFIGLAIIAVSASTLFAQAPPAPPSTLLVAVDRRPALSLNGDWHIILDPYLNGITSFPKDESSLTHPRIEYDFAKSPTLKVPGDWNTQRPALLNYEGALWYERHFTYQPQPGSHAFLHIGAANYRSRAFINGQLVCTHEGGFTPFDCDISDPVKSGDNSVVILVDDTRLADGVPTLKTDWYNYGGLTRDVSIVTLPATYIDDFDLHLARLSEASPTRTKIEGYIHLIGAPAGTTVSVDLSEIHLHTTATTDATGRALISLPAPSLALWSPQSPKLYKVKLSAATDTLTDLIGFRTIETSGSRILLNGKPIVLHGVCIHAEAPFRSGRVDNQQDVNTLFAWVKELNANYVRLATTPTTSS